MADKKECLFEFLGTAFDELADADVPVFKQVKGVFNVGKAGKKLLNTVHGEQFYKHQKMLQEELEALAKDGHTDENDLRELNIQFAELLKTSTDPIHLCKSKKELETELRNRTGVQPESELPGRFVEIIYKNLTQLFSSEMWSDAIYDRVVEEGEKTRESVDKAEGIVIEKIEYSGSFQEYLDGTHLPKSFSEVEKKGSRFHYLNDRIRFHGRETEKRQVDQFLSCKKPIAMWAFTGQGGVGKSKFARFICESHQSEYTTVWLTEEEFEKLRYVKGDYISRKPVLFVCDYADEKLKQLRFLIEKMQYSNVKSRFILLVREKTTYENLKTDHFLSRFHYNPTETDGSVMSPLDLSEIPLDHTAYKEILEDYREAYYRETELSNEDYEMIIQKAEQIVLNNSSQQRANRCLFVLLIADAYLEDSSNWNIDADALLAEYFERNINHLKQKGYKENTIHSGLRLLAFATMSNGVSLNENDQALPDCVKKDIETIFNDFNDSQEAITSFLNQISDGMFDEGDNRLYPYEPDIIGEYLVLWQFFYCLSKRLKGAWIQYMREQIQGEDTDDTTSPVETFISRCSADWNKLGGELNRIVTEISGE